MDKEIWTTYSQESDMTFIMKEDSKNKTLKVVGFYFGKPNENDTETFINCVEAKFE